MSCQQSPFFSKISKETKVIRAGLLKKFKKGFLSKGFKIVYAELTDDSHLIWYKDQCSYKSEGAIFLSNVCDFLAVGPYTRSIPGRPNLPKGASERHVIAVPSLPRKDSTVHWFLCYNDNEMNEWMTSISSVLPPLPPPKDPPPENNDFKDPPPPYPGGGRVAETKMNPQPPPTTPTTTPTPAPTPALPAPALPAAAAKESGYKPHEMGVNNHDKDTNGSVVVSAAVLSSWGWTWGWGGGWGYDGWGCFDFGPCSDHQTENLDVNNQYGTSDDSCRNGPTSSSGHNNECEVSDQTGYDYDQADLDAGCDAVYDGSGFDVGGFDVGGFDVGFSIGF